MKSDNYCITVHENMYDEKSFFSIYVQYSMWYGISKVQDNMI